MCPRLRECCRKAKAEVVSKGSNKIQQTWGSPFSRALYIPRFYLHFKLGSWVSLQQSNLANLLNCKTALCPGAVAQIHNSTSSRTPIERLSIKALYYSHLFHQGRRVRHCSANHLAPQDKTDGPREYPAPTCR